MSIDFKAFFNSTEYKALRLVLSVTLILILSVWAYQVTQYNHHLSSINMPQFERCYYLKCKTNFLGYLNCETAPMREDSLNNVVIWTENTT